jgi:hypothetical protein
MRLPRMTTLRWMVAIGVIALTIGGTGWAHRSILHWQRIERIRRERVASALKAFRGVERAFIGGEIEVDPFYLWSRRLMECQLEVSRSKADRIAAIRAHRRRLSILWDPRGDGKTCWTERTVDSIVFYQQEAELWLAQQE